MIFLFKQVIFRFHVSFQECKWYLTFNKTCWDLLMRDFLCHLSKWYTVNFPSAILRKRWAFSWRQDPSCSNIFEKRKGYVSLLNSIVAFEWEDRYELLNIHRYSQKSTQVFFFIRGPGYFHNFHMLKLKHHPIGTPEAHGTNPSKSANDFGWKFAFHLRRGKYPETLCWICLRWLEHGSKTMYPKCWKKMAG